MKLNSAKVASAAILIAFSAQLSPALAQCADATVNPSAPEVLCTGEDTNGLEDDRNNLTVSVLAGATVSNSNDDAVRVDGDNVTVNNLGTITATGSGDEGIQSNGANFSLTNRGVITALDKGVQASDEDGATIVNSGTIDSVDEGIEARDVAVITNEETGVIESDEDGVQFGSGTLSNSGSITGGNAGGADAGDGVDIDSGFIRNFASGSIVSNSAGSAGIDVDPENTSGSPVTGVLVINNNGLISGDFGILVDPGSIDMPNNSIQIVANLGGRIVGTGGIAMALAGGDDQVIIGEDLMTNVASEILGDVLFQQGNDTLELGVNVGAQDMALFDGGAGTDTVLFSNGVTFADISILAIAGDILELSYNTVGGEQGLIRVTNFELFNFGGSVVTLDDLLATVPLPAGFIFMLTGVAGLGVTRRFKRL